MIKIENLVHKYTIWKDENTKSEKTVLDGWFRKVYIGKTFKCTAASE